MSGIDWSKAPAGTTHAKPTLAAFYWLKEHDGTWWWRVDSSKYWGMFVPDDAEFPLYIPRPSPAWNGDGLPPVGEVCEALWHESRNEWLKTKVFGVNEHEQPVHRWEEGPKKFDYQASPLTGFGGKPYFRPIRTPEQIAEDNRQLEAVKMFNIFCEATGASGADMSGFHAMYDAGLRFTEPTK